MWIVKQILLIETSLKAKLQCSHTPGITQSLTFLTSRMQFSCSPLAYQNRQTKWKKINKRPSRIFALRHTQRPRTGSARPLRHRVSVLQCRTRSGWELAGQTGRRCCAPLDPQRKPGSGGGPQSMTVPVRCRRPPGRGRGGYSPSRWDEPWRSKVGKKHRDLVTAIHVCFAWWLSSDADAQMKVFPIQCDIHNKCELFSTEF